MYDAADMRSKVVEASMARDRELQREKRMSEFRAKHPQAAEKLDARANGNAAQEGSYVEMFLYLGAAFVIILAISLGAAWVLMKYFA